MARNCFEKDQFVEASKLCDEVLINGDGVDKADAWYLRGLIEKKTGNLYAAITYLRQAISNNNTNEYYHYSLGDVFDLLGETEDAISCYEQALSINPNMATALNNLGCIFLQLGKKETSGAYFIKALLIDPQLEIAQKNLDLAQRKGVVRVAETCAILPFALIEPDGGEISIGDSTSVGRYAQLLAAGGKIEIGARCSIQSFCQLYGHGGLTIGNDVRVAAQTIMIPSNHNFDRCDCLISEQGTTDLGIVIGDDVWIGAGCKILDGVSIGVGCVIGAGSVVTTSIPPYSVAVGSPARVIRKRGAVPEKKDEGES